MCSYSKYFDYGAQFYLLKIVNTSESGKPETIEWFHSHVPVDNKGRSLQFRIPASWESKWD